VLGLLDEINCFEITAMQEAAMALFGSPQYVDPNLRRRRVPPLTESAADPSRASPDKHPHVRIAEHVNQVLDDRGGPEAMRQFLGEFPEARLVDWACAFCMGCLPFHGGPGPLVAELAHILHRFLELKVSELLDAALRVRTRLPR
jgi:hypothetical protein